MERIPLKEKVCYGFGDLSCNLMFQLVSAYLMFYYTDVVGIGLGSISFIMLISRIVDAVTDPMMGAIVDKTKSRWGKARPYVLWMAVPFAMISIAMFAVPNVSETGKFVYALITYILFCVVYTALNIPYSTMLSCMTDHEPDRLIFNMFKSMGASLGGFIVMGSTLGLVAALGRGNQRTGFLLTVTLYAAVGLLLLLVCFKNTKERIILDQEKVSVAASIKTAVKNKYWVLLCLIGFFNFASMILKSQSAMYYAKYYLNQEAAATVLMTIPTLMSFLISFFMPVIAKKIGKRNCVLVGSLLSAAGSVIQAAAGTLLAGVIAGTFVSAVGLGLTMGVMFVMGAETVDYTEWQTGERPQGIMTSVIGFIVKLSMALAGVVGAQVLKLGGYVENSVQSASSLRAIISNYIWIPVALACVVAFLSLFYDLDKRYAKIMEEVHARRK